MVADVCVIVVVRRMRRNGKKERKKEREEERKRERNRDRKRERECVCVREGEKQALEQKGVEVSCTSP